MLENCSKEALLTWYAQWKSKATGVHVDVPSPYEAESREDLELTVATGATGVH